MSLRSKDNYLRSSLFSSKFIKHRSIILNLIGLIITLIISSLLSWNTIVFWKIKEALPLVLLVSSGYIISSYLISKLTKFPKIEHFWVIFITLSTIFLTIIVMITFIRRYYSRVFLLSSYILSLFCFLIEYLLIKKRNKLTFVILPSSKTDNIDDLKKFNNIINFIKIYNPSQNINNVDGVVITSIENLDSEWYKFLVKQTLKGIPIYHISEIYEQMLGKIPLEYFYEEFLLDFKQTKISRIFKRIFDIVLVLLLSPFAIILGVVIAIMIKLDSEGPIFFVQKRVGEGGKVYDMIKFRTMYKDSEKNGPQFASENDPRITRVGRLLRKFRLDEIPQFINVLKGEMSLIGPRPEQVKFVEEYEKKIPFYNYRHLIKPGITGWAQIYHGYAAGLEENKEKLEYDLYYIKNQSIWLDIVIILKTIKVLLTKWGAK